MVGGLRKPPRLLPLRWLQGAVIAAFSWATFMERWEAGGGAGYGEGVLRLGWWEEDQGRRHCRRTKGNPTDRRGSCTFCLLVIPRFGLLPDGAR